MHRGPENPSRERFPAIRRGAWGTVFRNGRRWYECSQFDQSIELTVIDGDTGAFEEQRRVVGRAAFSTVERPLQPGQLSDGLVWVAAYTDVPIDEPPVAILSAIDLKQLFVSKHIAVTKPIRAR